MIATRLTFYGLAATIPDMQEIVSKLRRNGRQDGFNENVKSHFDRGHKRVKRCLMAAILVAGLPLLAGCINVNAPSEPIVIELNINIKQEVIYRLAADAGNTIEENPDIF